MHAIIKCSDKRNALRNKQFNLNKRDPFYLPHFVVNEKSGTGTLFFKHFIFLSRTQIIQPASEFDSLWYRVIVFAVRSSTIRSERVKITSVSNFTTLKTGNKSVPVAGVWHSFCCVENRPLFEDMKRAKEHKGITSSSGKEAFQCMLVLFDMYRLLMQRGTMVGRTLARIEAGFLSYISQPYEIFKDDAKTMSVRCRLSVAECLHH